jgi:succinyl-diaminopimelate desuccinylase
MKSEAQYLAQLVKFPTVSGDHISAKTCADFCATFFERHGLYTTIAQSGEFYNLIATTKETKHPKVFLQAHMDVLAADDALFSLRREKGNFVGRGVYDMKFACASYMAMIDSMGESVTSYDFGIMLTFDEEIGGRDGVKFLIDQGYSCDACILPDGGDNWKLEASANGAWFVRLIADGKTAHGSRPEEGVNAASQLMRTANKILQKYAGNVSVDGVTCSLTGLQAGEAMNQIPNRAEATFDIRFRDREIYASIKAAITDIASSGDVCLETLDYSAPMQTNADDPVVKYFSAIAEDVLGQPLETCHSYGATDGRYFSERAIPCIIIRPQGGGAHSEGEWVRAADLPRFTDLITRFITSYARVSPVPVNRLDSVAITSK